MPATVTVSVPAATTRVAVSDLPTTKAFTVTKTGTGPFTVSITVDNSGASAFKSTENGTLYFTVSATGTLTPDT